MNRWLFVLLLPLSVSDSVQAQVSYHRDVLPLLKRHCWSCHNKNDPQGGLNLETVASFAKGGDKGPGFKAGKPDQSLAVQMVTGQKKPAMPLKAPPLSPAKVETLRLWILAGAKDDSPPEAETKVAAPKVYAIAPAITALAIHPSGKQGAAACGSEIAFFDLESESPGRRLPTACANLTFVEYSPDGKLLAFAGGMPGQHGEVGVVDLSAEQPGVKTRRLSSDTLFRGAFSPDGKSLALGGADGAVYFIDASDLSKIKKFDLHSDWVHDVAFASGGKLLVSVGRDKSVKVAQADTGALVRTIASTSDAVNAVAASGNFAYSGGRDRNVASYDLQSSLGPVALSGSGNGVVANTPVGKYTKSIDSTPGEILDFALARKKNVLAVAGLFADTRIIVLDKGKREATLPPNAGGPFYSAALSDDGTLLALGSAQGEVHLYTLPKLQLLRKFTPVPVK